MAFGRLSYITYKGVILCRAASVSYTRLNTLWISVWHTISPLAGIHRSWKQDVATEYWSGPSYHHPEWLSGEAFASCACNLYFPGLENLFPKEGIFPPGHTTNESNELEVKAVTWHLGLPVPQVNKQRRQLLWMGKFGCQSKGRRSRKHEVCLLVLPCLWLKPLERTITQSVRNI